MDAAWFYRGLAFEEFEAEERARQTREQTARSRTRTVRTMSGDTVSME